MRTADCGGNVLRTAVSLRRIPISSISSLPRDVRGFTLLELLVVLVIIGVLATMVSLTVSGRAVDDRMQAESRRLQELLRLASDEAQAKGLELGFRQTVEGFDFVTPDSSNAHWDVVEEGLFRPRQVPAPFYLELRVDGRVVRPVPVFTFSKDDKKTDTEGDNESGKKSDGKRIEPQLLILSTGEMTAFTLDLKLKDMPAYYRVEGNELGELKSERQEDKQ